MSSIPPNRKRRSSILKMKPRAPLGELEFNPSTPSDVRTDDTKSRRVSFSRKKDVAEYVVNEETTIFRNFYEEQNRSQESSGNESAFQRPVMTNTSVHQQFTDLEAEIDFTTLCPPAQNSGPNISHLNDVYFAEQIASLDCMTGNQSLKLPTQNLDLSMMVDKSKVFSDGFTNPLVVEHTGRIEIDFSIIQEVKQPDLYSDDQLDTANDVEGTNPSVAGSFMNEFNNRSHYCEVDLNETKGFHEVSDMSITDTIQSPIVQAVTRNIKDDLRNKSGMDLIADKENIIVEATRPKHYADPPPQIDENVLVFDGKKLKVANLHDNIDDLLPNTPEIVHKSKLCKDRQSDMKKLSEMNKSLAKEIEKQNSLFKTKMSVSVNNMMDMSLNDNDENKSVDELIRCVNRNQSIKEKYCLYENIGQIEECSNKKSLLAYHSNSQESVKPLKTVSKDFPQRRNTILNYDDDLPNFTLDVAPHLEKSGGLRKTVVFDPDDSLNKSNMQCISQNVNVISVKQTSSEKEELTSIIVPNVSQEKRLTTLFCCEMTKLDDKQDGMADNNDQIKTIFFEEQDRMADMSMTQAISSSVQQKRRTVVFDRDDNMADMSMTQAIPTIIQEKRRTVVFDKNDNMADMSMTQAIPAIIQEKRRTVVFNRDDNTADMSMTQAIPISMQEKRRTVVFDRDDNMADMSMTQAIPTIMQEKRQTVVFDRDDNMAELSMTMTIPSKCVPESTEKSRTIFFGDQDQIANMSITQAIPTIMQEKRQTVVFDRDDNMANMSMTQAIPTIMQEKRQTVVFDRDDNMADMSMTQAIPTIMQEKRQIVVFDSDYTKVDIVIKMDVPSKSITDSTENRKTIVFGEQDQMANMSMTQAIPTIMHEKCQTVVFDRDDNMADMSMTQAIPTIVQEKRRTIVCDSDDTKADILINMDVPSKSNPESTEKRRTTVFGEQDQMAHVSMTQAIPTIMQEKRQTVVFDRDGNMADMSMTRAIPTIVQEQRRTIVFDSDDTKADILVNMDVPSKSIPESTEKRRRTVFGEQDQMAHVSMTQAIPTIMQEKRQTVVFDRDENMADMSMTQAIPTIIQEKRRTVVFDKDDNMADMSMTQAIPTCMQEKRQTVVFDRDDNMADMSMTQAIPISMQEKRQTVVFDRDDNMADMSMTQAIPISMQEKRQTVVFDRDDNMADMSMTQAIPTIMQEKRQTVVFDKNYNMADMSMTQAIPTIMQEKRQTVVFDRDDNMADISLTQAIPCMQEKHCTLLFDRDDTKADMIMTTAISQNVIQADNESRRTIFFDKRDEIGDTPDVMQEKIASLYDKEYKDNNLLIVKSIFKENENKSELNQAESYNKYDILESFHRKEENFITEKELPIQNIDYTTSQSSAIEVENKMQDNMYDNDLPHNLIKQVVPQHGLPQTSKEIRTSMLGSFADVGTKKFFIEEQQLNSSQIITKSNINEPTDTTESHSVKNNREHEAYENILNYNSKLLQVRQNIEKELRTNEQDMLQYVSDVEGSEKKQLVSEQDIVENNEQNAAKTNNIEDYNIDTTSSQDLQSKYLNSSRNNGCLTINFDDKIDLDGTKRKTGCFDKSTKMVFNDTNDLLNLLTKYSEPSQKESQTTLIRNKMNMSIEERNHSEASNKSANSEKPLTNHKDIDSLGKICDGQSLSSIVTIDKQITSPPKNISTELHTSKNLKPATVNLTEASDKDDNSFNERKSIFTKQRKSILSREEIRNNISVVLALRQSQFEANNTMDDTSMDEESMECEVSVEKPQHNKSVRLSKDVVKTLKFDEDDSLCRTPQEASNLPSSVVQKDNRNMEYQSKFNTNIPKVIPQGLNDHQLDDIKDIMAHLVKPTAELPLHNEEKPNEIVDLDLANASLQCNIERSSQVEVGENSKANEMQRKSESANGRITFSPETHHEKEEEAGQTEQKSQKYMEELLENTSTITLVDNTINQMDTDSETDHAPYSQTTVTTTSSNVLTSESEVNNVKILYSVGNSFSEGEITESESKIPESVDGNRSRKRNFNLRELSKHKSCTLEVSELTPRPQEKIQRISKSPTITSSTFSEHRNIVRYTEEAKMYPTCHVSISPDKSPGNFHNISPKTRSPEKSTILLKTTKNTTGLSNSPVKATGETPDIDPKINSRISNADPKGQNLISKFDKLNESTKRLSVAVKDVSVLEKCDDSMNMTEEGESIHMVWEGKERNEVVEEINKLPFIETWYCDWESREREMWTFLLMNSRIRLRIKMAPMQSKDTVGPDTRIEGLDVESLLAEGTHVVASWCINAAVQAIRAGCASGEDAACDVPGLLCKLGGLVRAATQWGRTMYATMLHLAYTLTSEGQLTLQVANVPLRTVWEVTMKVAMHSDVELSDVPWPRATDVRVTSVSGEAAPSERIVAEVAGRVQRGWGHVPNTIWKIFKHLKHKTRDDDLMAFLMR